MPSFTIASGNPEVFVDTVPGDGFIIDFATLDNGFNIEVNGVDLFVNGPGTAPNELEFQVGSTQGQTVRFADGSLYGEDSIPEIWQLGRSSDELIVRLIVNPDGTIELFGTKSDGGPLEPLELFNGLTVNSAAIAAAWDSNGNNTVVLGQSTTGPTNAAGDFESVVCFARGTSIETDKGPILVEDLKYGDLVHTLDNGSQPVRWIGSRVLNSDSLASNPKLKPIRIRANALAEGCPDRDLIVSQQHRVLVSSKIAMRIFNAYEILIPAKKLLSFDGIDVVEDCPNGVEYFHFLFDRHEIIWSNGALTEALYTGPEALKSLSQEARSEIQALFPECTKQKTLPQLARREAKRGKETRKFLARHRKNKKPLFEAHL